MAPPRSLSRAPSMDNYPSTKDAQFLRTLKSWLDTHAEVLLMIRYSGAAGSKRFEFFRSFREIAERMQELPPRTSVICFREPQLPLRGVVDDEFIAECLSRIPDGSEYLVVETTRRVYGQASWFHHGAGESHAELSEELEDARGRPVAAGAYPPWLYDTEDVISAVVPDADGTPRSGVY